MTAYQRDTEAAPETVSASDATTDSASSGLDDEQEASGDSAGSIGTPGQISAEALAQETAEPASKQKAGNESADARADTDRDGSGNGSSGDSDSAATAAAGGGPGGGGSGRSGARGNTSAAALSGGNTGVGQRASKEAQGAGSNTSSPGRSTEGPENQSVAQAASRSVNPAPSSRGAGYTDRGTNAQRPDNTRQAERTSPASLNSFVGSRARIEMTDGRTFNGRIASVQGNNVLIERHLEGGEVTYHLDQSEMARAAVLR